MKGFIFFVIDYNNIIIRHLENRFRKSIIYMDIVDLLVDLDPQFFVSNRF